MPHYITQETLKFLQNLSQNNNKDWFTDNKDWYLKSQKNVIDFVEDLLDRMGNFDIEFQKIEAKKTLFRIYRDTRFSKDKMPYKTNFGASLGMKKGNEKAGYYLHIEPGKSFIAGGIYLPSSPVLKLIRSEISLFGEEVLEIIEKKSFKKIFPQLSQEDQLKKIPTGFDKDHPLAEILKLKSFLVILDLEDNFLNDPNATTKISHYFEIMKPFVDYLNKIIQNT